MTMKRKVAGVAMAAVLAGLGVVGTATSASAEPCPSGATCAYDFINYDAHYGPVYGDNGDLTNFYQWTSAESIYNNGTSCDVYIYSGIYYGGTRYPLARGSGWSNLYNSHTALLHHAYSNKWYNCS